MTSLNPHQQDLLDILKNSERPRFGVVESPTGAGIRRAVELYVGQVATESRILILCSTLAEVRQWAERLQADEDLRVIVLDSATSSLDLLDGRDTETGVILTTYARARHGLSGRALAELDFGLILHDHPPVPFPGEVSRLNSRAREAIALLRGPQTGERTLGWPTLLTITLEQVLQGGQLTPIQIPVHSTPEERELRGEAISLLREAAARKGHPLIVPSDSLPVLHSRLLGLASDSGEQDDFAKRAWQLLDRMEGTFAHDSRLAALDAFLFKATGEGARCVVLTVTIADARYIADHYSEVGHGPRAVVTGSMTMADRLGVFSGMHSGEFVVATNAVVESRDGWPAGATVILWPSPAIRRSRVLGELAWIAEISGRLTVAELSDA